MEKREKLNLIIVLIIGVLLMTSRFAIAADAPESQATTPQPTTSQPETPSPETRQLSGYKYSGFLSDYSMLKPAPDGSDAMSWRKPGVDFKIYDKIIVERLNFFYKDDADYKGIDPTELKALGDYFHETFMKEIGKIYPVVTEPGPGVLRVRAALTDIVPNKPAVSVVTLVVPYLTFADLGTSAVAKGGPGSNFYVGYTTIEAEFIDSVTNEQVAAYVDRYYPKKYDVDFKKGPVGVVTHGFGQYFKAYSTWSYTKDAFDYWAHKLQQKLDEAHGKIKAKE
jgi:hypothetical protein